MCISLQINQKVVTSSNEQSKTVLGKQLCQDSLNMTQISVKCIKFSYDGRQSEKYS